jgi:hypothetical protein
LRNTANFECYRYVLREQLMRHELSLERLQTNIFRSR